MGARRDYLTATLSQAFADWDLGERVFALILIVVSGLGYIGNWLGWWQPDDSLFQVGAVASVLLLVWFVYLIVVDVPVRIWDQQRQRIDSLTDTTLSLDVSRLYPTPSPRWKGYKCSLAVVNSGNDFIHLRAQVLPPLSGLGPSDHEYWTFYLQWDRGSQMEIELGPGEPAKLHVAKVGENRDLQFIGPGEFGGPQTPDRWWLYDAVKIVGTVQGAIEFRSGRQCTRRAFAIELDHENRPTISVDEPEPCQEATDS